MTEEIRNFEEIENTEMVEINEETENSGIGTVVKIVAGVVITGLGILAYKNRHKLEERQIRKLEKKGYLVVRPEDEMPVEAYSEEVEDDE